MKEARAAFLAVKRERFVEKPLVQIKAERRPPPGLENPHARLRKRACGSAGRLYSLAPEGGGEADPLEGLDRAVRGLNRVGYLRRDGGGTAAPLGSAMFRIRSFRPSAFIPDDMWTRPPAQSRRLSIPRPRLNGMRMENSPAITFTARPTIRTPARSSNAASSVSGLANPLKRWIRGATANSYWICCEN
jgi:hypothetical protein